MGRSARLLLVEDGEVGAAAEEQGAGGGEDQEGKALFVHGWMGAHLMVRR
jgi:hypothetical protein